MRGDSSRRDESPVAIYEPGVETPGNLRQSPRDEVKALLHANRREATKSARPEAGRQQPPLKVDVVIHLRQSAPSEPPSQSDAMKVSVGFNPRSAFARSRSRRRATIEEFGLRHDGGMVRHGSVDQPSLRDEIGRVSLRSGR